MLVDSGRKRPVSVLQATQPQLYSAPTPCLSGAGHSDLTVLRSQVQVSESPATQARQEEWSIEHTFLANRALAGCSQSLILWTHLLGMLMREHTAEQDEALRPDLLTLCVNCSSWTHAAFQLPGAIQVCRCAWSVCVCLCVLISVLVCEHVRRCL